MLGLTNKDIVKLVLELIIVFLGVFLAAQINDCQKEIEQSERENKYIELLYTELSNSTDALRLTVNQCEVIESDIEEINNYVKNGYPKDFILDRINSSDLFNFKFIYPKYTHLESLLKTGNYVYIKDIELLKEIAIVDSELEMAQFVWRSFIDYFISYFHPHVINDFATTYVQVNGELQKGSDEVLEMIDLYITLDTYKVRIHLYKSGLEALIGTTEKLEKLLSLKIE